MTHHGDIIGRKLGRLMVTGQSRCPRGRVYYDCVCDCGTVKRVQRVHLVSGVTRSCGCLQSDITADRNRTHGMRGTPEYEVWAAMVQRCTNIRNARYADYGGRGIRVCDSWRSSFTYFISDMGLRPSSYHSVERRDNDKGYEPGNCYWGTADDQNNNTRRNCLIEMDGVTKNVTQWCRDLNLSYRTVKARLVQHGWDPVRALSTKTKSGFKELA